MGYTQLISASSPTRGIATSAMYNREGGWTVLRPTTATTSQKIANGARSAIENSSHLTYSQNNRYDVFKMGFTAGSSMDCSSMGTYIVNTYAGGNMSQLTTSADFVANASATGLFMEPTRYTPGMELYPGDILVNRYNDQGHVAIVGDGNGAIRVGANQELLTGTSKLAGFGMNLGDYWSDEGFKPRVNAPEIEPESEYLPEEIIELLDLGLITKEELEEWYDMYFIYEGRGGYSPFSQVPLTNKTYAWNRFAEAMKCKESCPLSRGDPGGWVMDNSIFNVDMAPELGAAMCFSNTKGGEGYACIVESIEGGEMLITSQVEGGQFSLKERVKRYGAWDFDSYMFVGFVHNPGAWMGAEDETALETFLRIADEQVGSGPGWTYENTGIQSPNGWSGAFVTACSKRAGSSLNIIIPNVDSVSTIGRVGVLRGMGKWHKGPIYGGSYEPSAGDIAIFRYHHTGKENIYKGDKAAIVFEGGGGGFEGIMGDDGGYVSKKSYSTSSGMIAGYFSPNWEQIDGTTASKKEYRKLQGLYTEGVTKNDACARTVGYVNSNYKPSISPSKVKLAAVNYTGMLANFYSVFAQAGISTATNSELVVDYWTNTVKSYYQQFPGDFNPVSGEVTSLTSMLSSGLDSPLNSSYGWYAQNTEVSDVSVTATVQDIYSFFRAKGLNSAATTAIIANIKAESGFRTGAIGDSGTSVGLVQWHASRMKSMQSAVGADWATNVTGQLEYIWTELNSGYKGVLNRLQQIPDTAEGARQAVQVWVEKYEIPQDIPGATKTRQGYVNGYYQQLGG